LNFWCPIHWWIEQWWGHFCFVSVLKGWFLIFQY
jgi:hypothetical protein